VKTLPDLTARPSGRLTPGSRGRAWSAGAHGGADRAPALLKRVGAPASVAAQRGRARMRKARDSRRGPCRGCKSSSA
jgi:hypothetical protein